MACAAPLRAYAPSNGGRVRFWKTTDKEYHVEPYTGLTIPCGTCILCREEYARQTAIRITHEATLWETNCFLTLTYTDELMPQYGSLDYSHLVKFWKRLRKQIGPLRYYAVGEYGGKTHRPHYHVCLFGHDFTEDGIVVREGEMPLWISPSLEKLWGLGQVRVGKLCVATARYTASYVVKKLRRKQQYVRTDDETGELIPLIQPRAFMSRNLGKEWWEKWHKGVANHDHVIITGKPQKPPRAYDKWLKAKDEKRIGEIKEQRIARAKPMTREESRARAENARARVKTKEGI